jgi:hypothetical protein
VIGAPRRGAVTSSTQTANAVKGRMKARMRKQLLLAVFMVMLLCVLASPAPEAKAHTGTSPYTTNLIADGGSAATAVDVGDVLVWNDEDYLYVKYVTTDDWYITEVHLEVATISGGIPQAKGNPIPGKFTYKAEGLWTQEYLFTIPLSWDSDKQLSIAAHAVVGHAVSGCIDLYSNATTMVTDGNEEGATYPKLAVEVTGPWGDLGFSSDSKWIWETAEVVHPIAGDIVEFSREFTINGLYLVDKTGSLKITADNGYEVHLNSGFVGRAQLDESFRTASKLSNEIVWWYDKYPPDPKDTGGAPPYGWSTPETYDISSMLQVGLNTLNITGVNEYCDIDEYPYIEGTVANNPAGVRYEAHICYTVVDRRETAWGAGEPFPGKNWATYFTYTVQGWKLVEAVTVESKDPYGADSARNLEADKQYKFVVTGSYWRNTGGSPNQLCDAEYTTYETENWNPYHDGCLGYTSGWLAGWTWLGANFGDLQVNGQFVDWGSFNENHEYTLVFGAGTGSKVNFRIFDGNGETGEQVPGWYRDNIGSLTVEIYVWE